MEKTLEGVLCDLNRAVECLAVYIYCRQFKIVPNYSWSFRKHIMRTHFHL